MFGLIFCAILFFVGLIISIIIFKCDLYDFEFIGYAAATIAIGAFLIGVISGTTLINIDRKFDGFINRYEAAKEIVDSYTPNDYGNQAALLEEVLSINHTIATHKAFAGNSWNGRWYSEDIANLEPIKFTAGKQ